MKILPFVSVVTLLGWMVPASCFATSVGISTVEQPVNLGAKSDPQRIPLGRVGVISNYDYGIHGKIDEARPCPDGAMRWEEGSELDQNLASVFGISVEAQDPTQIMAFPVTLRVKPWKPPGYSPYTKEQVLAATLWCLLHSTYGTPERPLDVRVVAEGPDDKPLEAKYSGKYVTDPGKDEKEVPPAKVPGTVIETDAKGTHWVVFADVTKKAAVAPPAYGLIIVDEGGGDGDTGWSLFPVWGNGDMVLEAFNYPAPMLYSSFHGVGITDANSFLAEGGANRFTASCGDKSDTVSLSYPRVKPATLAAGILGLVISAQPVEAKPLTVSFHVEESGLAKYSAFRSAEGWQETRQDNGSSHIIELKCEFVWDAATHKLTKGSVPLVHLERPAWITPNPVEEKPFTDVEREIAGAVETRIKDGIRDGSLLAEKIMTADTLADSGLKREIGKAGYYEGLAIFCNGTAIPEKPLNNPAWFNNPSFDRAHEEAWTIGLNRGEAIAIEVRKAFEAEKLKKGG
ncbi:MAG: hypothetical protein ABIS50_23520 [Luteolibacter sp.]|uniref:hypothetical protein n=1 Tax=Luteolibacter sp. TaxID=1962973 RepID=UPI0032630A0B